MADTSYPQPDIPANEPSIHAHSPIYSALINAGAPPPVATTLTAISGAESSFGKSPVSGVNRDGSRDYGYFQVNNKAWPQFGGAAVASLPLADQAKAAVHIWNKQGPHAWSTYTSGAYKNYLSTADKAAVAPPLSKTPSAPTPTVGSMLAGLTQPTGSDGKGPSQLQQASSDIGGGGGGGSQQQPEAPQNDLQGQQAAAMMGQARQQQIAAQAQQMVASMLSRGRQPLTWSAAPPGSGYGATGVPGTTLNSIGDQYG